MGPIFAFLSLSFLLLFSPAALATQKPVKVDWGADAYVRSYMRETPEGDKASGFAQMLRLRLDLTPGEGLALRTRTVFSGDKWDGDQAGVTGNSDNGGGGNNVRLDYGFLEFAEKGWMFRAGRQVASWADCLTVCDDRRDRFLVMNNLGKVMFFFVYDKRSEGDELSRSDDGDMYSVLALGLSESYEWGFLSAWWHNSKGNYLLKDVISLSPYIKVFNQTSQLKLLYHWIGQGDDGSLFPSHHHSAALKLEHQLSQKWKLQAQTLQVFNGGYVATGYDTYLSMVNNDRDHNSSNIRLVYLGGLGTFNGGDKKRDYLYSTKMSYRLNSRLTLAAAIGSLTFYESKQDKSISQTVVDFSARYKLNSFSSIKASFGRLMGDRYQNASMAQFEAEF